MRISIAAACLALLLAATRAQADPIPLFTSNTSGSSQQDPPLQSFALGLDFEVVADWIVVSALGFYDELDETGVGLAFDHPVHIFALDGTLIATAVVTRGTSLPYIGGYRYVSITPVVLPKGFVGSIVVGMLPGNTDPNGNSHGWKPGDPLPPFPFDPPPTVNDGNGALVLIGAGRFGFDPYGFPAILDGGPANRYTAGSLVYEPVPEPGLLAVWGLGALAVAGRRWWRAGRSSGRWAR